VTRLASGIPMGSDIEHSDELTLSRSLLNRRDLA
jgi:recombinational DNA repair protein RecR